MDTPFFFTDPYIYDLGVRCYPGLQAHLAEGIDLTPDRLLAQFDVLFETVCGERSRFDAIFEPYAEEYKKRLIWVLCPHGNSDKGHASNTLDYITQPDLVLLYGQRMVDFFSLVGIYPRLRHTVMSGNYRYLYYKKHKQTLDALIEQEVFSQFARKQPTILYAPTWNEGDETFFFAYRAVLDGLPSHYNLVVKLHPWMLDKNLGRLSVIMDQYQGRGNIVFVSDFPLIYPLLAHVDIYFGDMSSIGYDFLTFNKPLFFLHPAATVPVISEASYLFRCGTAISHEAFPYLYTEIDKHLKHDRERFTQIREKAYHYTFGAERSFEELRKEIWNRCYTIRGEYAH